MPVRIERERPGELREPCVMEASYWAETPLEALEELGILRFRQSFSRLLHPHEGSPEALGWVEPLIRGHFLVIKAHSEALSGIQEYPRNRHEILRWAGWVRQ